MSSPKQTKVLIAGGSIAGLTLANILEKLGIDYLVLEKYREIAPDVGASIGIFANGFRILDQIGCHAAIKGLIEDVGSYKTLTVRDEHGQIVTKVQNITDVLNELVGYELLFVDRQMLIEILYNNLPDKSKILTSKGVTKVTQSTGSVQVVTEDGETFDGDILVAADGIHSQVRREMWRLADQEAPGYFPSNRSKVPTEYCCMFGISRPSDKFPKNAGEQRQGANHSYLIATGPNHRVYWFLFKKLPKTVYGLHEDIPRYTAEQEDALAAEHASDLVTETLTFGELYASRTVATLQALPEVVFQKWHYNRIITIGDAAHKYNPLSGQGGNSAIEDAAVLANELHARLTQENRTSKLTDSEITDAFSAVQNLRADRCTMLMKQSREQQSIQAKETFISSFMARYILPLTPMAGVERAVSAIRGAARVKALPLPDRPHSRPFDDEREPALVNWKYTGIATSAAIAALAVFAGRNSHFSAASLSTLLLSIQPKA